MSLSQIRSLDYAILLCTRMEETRAFYRDVMKFPLETDLERWVSFRVGATLLTLRPRGPGLVGDDGPSMPGRRRSSWPSASRRRRSTRAMRNWSLAVCRS